jgi:hypothetical protein
VDHADRAREDAPPARNPGATTVHDEPRRRGPTEPELLIFRFEPDPEAPGEARARTAEALESSPHIDTVLVLVSELVTNAVLHTSHVSELRVSRRAIDERDGRAGHVVRVEVRDGDRVIPSSPPTPGAHGGFGLRIVAAMADAWGCTVLEHGKIMWFEVGARE